MKSFVANCQALFALFVLVGFYVLTLGLAAGALWWTWAMINGEVPLRTRLAAALVLIAGALLFSLFPRVSRGAPAGIPIRPETQPELFRLISQLAKRMNQKMPAEVFVTAEVNASVAVLNSFVGLGGRRVLTLGLPLMQILTRAQMLAVLAHEFGHFQGGHARLGAIVHRAHMAMGSTIKNLIGVGSYLYLPFRSYGRFFLRVSSSVSRRQEYVADSVAARVVGANHLAAALEELNLASALFDSYLSVEFIPVLEEGRRPPFAEGFRRYFRNLASDDLRAALARHERRVRAPKFLDTHPPLRDRQKALRTEPQGQLADDGRSAIEILRDLDRLEAELIAGPDAPSESEGPSTIAWEDVLEEVLMPRWARRAEASSEALVGIAPPQLPALVQNPAPLRLQSGPGLPPPPKELKERALAVLGSSLVVVLHHKGWETGTGVGLPVTLRRGEWSFLPFEELAAAAEEQSAAARWADTCRSFGIEGLDLGQALGARAAPAPASLPRASASVQAPPVVRRSRRRR